MPTTCPPVRRCGTHAPGWIKGHHPSVADGEVTREVCYHWTNDCCRWKNNIKVKNCGAFFVYELQKTPVCSLRYCGECRVTLLDNVSQLCNKCWKERNHCRLSYEVGQRKSSPTFSVRPRSSVGRVTVDLIRRPWVRFPPRSNDFFFASCGSLIPFTRANAQWVIHGSIST